MKWRYPIGHHRNEWPGATTPGLVALWSAGIGDDFPLGLTNILCLKPPVKHVSFIHVLLLKPPFSFRYSFQASVANAIESMLQEWWVQNCIRTEHLVFVTGFKKSKENSRTPKTRRICWFAVVYPLCMHMHESQRKGTSLFLRPYNAKIYISRLSVTTKKSRTPPVPRPQLGCHGKGEAVEAGRCSSPQRGPNQKGFG